MVTPRQDLKLKIADSQAYNAGTKFKNYTLFDGMG